MFWTAVKLDVEGNRGLLPTKSIPIQLHINQPGQVFQPVRYAASQVVAFQY